MTDKNQHIIKAFRISNKTGEIISEAAEELCLAKVDITRLLLNSAANNLKADAIKAGGFSNLNFGLVKNTNVPKPKQTFIKGGGLVQ